MKQGFLAIIALLAFALPSQAALIPPTPLENVEHQGNYAPGDFACHGAICRNDPVGRVDPDGRDYIDVSDNGEVFWVVEKDLFGLVNPDVRRISIGSAPVRTRLFRGSRVTGDVFLKPAFGGTHMQLEYLQKAASIFWVPRPTGGLAAGESRTFWQRQSSEQDQVVSSFLKGFVRRLADAYSGEAFEYFYLEKLMTMPYTIYNVPYVLGLGPYAINRGFLNNPAIDVGSAGAIGRLYFYRGKLYTSSEMGNIAAGKSTTFAWGGSVGAGSLIFAEASDVCQHLGIRTWDEHARAIHGSFKMNILGGIQCWKEYPVVGVFNTFTPPPLFPTLNWAVWHQENQ